mmetsp:Transcript_33764/g.95534  ORF Transcript_33764/g.95534 Transcript_33764/m.95534 type:complete len:243 (+) Transcript_33764:200-928(+)
MLRHSKITSNWLELIRRGTGSQFQTIREGSTRKEKVAIILKEDVEHLGSKGNVTSVRAGFFRNYLYPQKLAVYATRENISMLAKSELESARKKDENRRQAAIQQKQLSTIINCLTSKPVELLERTVEGTAALYGSVTPRSICDAVRKQLNIALPESRIMVTEPIRTTGLHRIPLYLSSDSTSEPTYMSVVVKAASTVQYNSSNPAVEGSEDKGSATGSKADKNDAAKPKERQDSSPEDHWID